jgi:hypothetical protein
MTKKYAEKAIEILRKADIDARGVNLFGLNGIALKQGFYGQTCYSWPSLRKALQEMRRKRAH